MPRSMITPGDGDPRHGTDNGYDNLSCRCAECKGAHAAARRLVTDEARERHRVAARAYRQRQKEQKNANR